MNWSNLRKAEENFFSFIKWEIRIFPYRDDRKPKFNDRKDQIIFFIHSFIILSIHLFTPSKKYLLNALIVSDIVLEMKRKIRNDCYLLMKLTRW